MNKRRRFRRNRNRRRRVKRASITRDRIQSLLHDQANVYKAHNIYAYQNPSTDSNNPIQWFIPRLEATPGIIKSIIEATSSTTTAYDADNLKYVWVVKDQKTQVKVKNNEINPLNLTMYWCEWRDTQYMSSTTAAKDEIRETVMWHLVQGWYNKTSAAAQAQFTDAGPSSLWQSGDTTFFTGNPFLSPFDSRNFVKLALVKWKKTVRLAPQQELHFTLRAPMVEWYDPLMDVESKLGYKGVTRFLLCQQHGDLGITAANAPGYTLAESIWEFKRTARVHGKNDTEDKTMISVATTGGGVDDKSFPAASTAVLGPTEMVMDDA